MRFLSGVMCASLAGYSGMALADGEESQSNWSFIPSIAYQQKLLSFDQSYHDLPTRMAFGSNISQEGRQSQFYVQLPTVNMSMTLGYKKAYAVYKYEQPLAPGSTSVDEQRPVAAPNAFFFLNGPEHNTSVRRYDQSLTLGYNVWGGLNAFIGYMQGRTELQPQGNCYTYPAYTCVQFNLAGYMILNGQRTYEQDYIEKGPLAGVSYSWQIGNAGTLSVSAAYAKMNGRYQDNFVIQDYSYPPYGMISGDSHFEFEGDSIGTSLGITWSAPVGDSSALFVDLRRQQYSMDANSVVTYVTKPGVTPDPSWNNVHVHTDETMLGFTAGYQYYF